MTLDPRNIEPDDYEYESSMPIAEVISFDAGFLEDLGDSRAVKMRSQVKRMIAQRKEWIERADREGVQQGCFVNRRTCDHCGNFLKYGEAYRHTSGFIIVIGSDCAMKAFGKDHGEVDINEIRKLLNSVQNYGQKARAIRSLLDANPGLEAALTYDEHNIVRSIRRVLLSRGSITEKQIRAVFRAVEEKWLDRPPASIFGPSYEPNAAPLEKGRRLIEGVVLNTQIRDARFGESLKMLIKDRDGNKLWGTVPKNLIQEAEQERTVLTGCRVRFVATVKPTRDHFGFFSRPKQSEIVEVAKGKEPEE